MTPGGVVEPKTNKQTNKHALYYCRAVPVLSGLPSSKASSQIFCGTCYCMVLTTARTVLRTAVKASSADSPFCAKMFRHHLSTTPDSLLLKRPYVTGCPLHVERGGDEIKYGETYRARKTAPWHTRDDISPVLGG